MNSKMVKSGMRVLIGREKTEVAVGWKLQPVVGTVVGERALVRVRYSQPTTRTSRMHHHQNLFMLFKRGKYEMEANY
jgi:hypothetical protein